MDREGQKQEHTEWVNVKVFGKQAETVGKFLLKGQMAYVEGKMQTRSWEDKEGNKKYTTEILAQRVQFGPSLAPKTKPPQTQQQNFGAEPNFNPGEELPF